MWDEVSWWRRRLAGDFIQCTVPMEPLAGRRRHNTALDVLIQSRLNLNPCYFVSFIFIA